MLMRQWWIGLLAALLAAPNLSAQNVDLSEGPLLRHCVRNELTMTLTGKINVKQLNKDHVYPLELSAHHAYAERYLDANGPVADKSARFYTLAEGVSRFNNEDAVKLTLRPERRFIVAQRTSEQLVAFSTRGLLTRVELDLLDHFDTLAVSGLVPGKTVATGKSWKLPAHVVMALCSLNALTDHNIEGTLIGVKDSIAFIKLAGKAQGIDRGAQVTMLINGRCEFDTKVKRVVAVEWKQADDRKQGPVSPAMSADVTIRLKRTPIEAPNDLGDNALVPVPTSKAPPAELTNIIHADPARRFEVPYAREWHVVSSDDSPQLVMRLIERGEFIAQATVTSLKKLDSKKVPTLDEFADQMAKTPGWEQDKEIERREIVKGRAKGHQTVYRIAATGQLDSVNTWQYFYLIVSPRGEQLIVNFSMIPQHVQRLSVRDEDLVREIVFP